GHPHAFDDHPLLRDQHADNPAALAFVGSGNHHDLVVFLNVTSGHKRKSKKPAELDDFGGHTDNFHELLLAQLACHGTEDARAARVQFLVDDDDGIAVKAQIRTIVPANRVAGAHNDGVHHFALFDRSIRCGFLDVRLDDVADVGIA